MADAMQASGVGPEIEYKGTVYTFQPVRPQEYGKFEAWLERQAWETIFRAEAWMPAAKYKEQVDATRRDMQAKVFSYGSEHYAKASVSASGLRRIALISLQAGHDNSPEITGDLIEKLFEDKPHEMASMLVGIGWVRGKDNADE